MAALDLTTIEAAAAWSGLPANTTAASDTIGRLVSAASQMIYGFLGRPYLFSRAMTERYDGTGGYRIMLRQFPITSVTAVSVDNVLIPASPTPGPGAAQPNGFLVEPWDGYSPGRMQSLDLFGYGFNRGRQNVVVSFVAGYLATEAATPDAAAYQATVTAPNGPWAVDAGVTFAATGAALTLVTGTPATGQYALVRGEAGKYQFAAADAGKGVLISYSYIPFDIFQCCTELVGERYAYKAHIGQVSKTLGGQETVTFSQADMPATMKLALQPYRRVV